MQAVPNRQCFAAEIWLAGKEHCVRVAVAVTPGRSVRTLDTSAVAWGNMCRMPAEVVLAKHQHHSTTV